MNPAAFPFVACTAVFLILGILAWVQLIAQYLFSRLVVAQ